MTMGFRHRRPSRQMEDHSGSGLEQYTANLSRLQKVSLQVTQPFRQTFAVSTAQGAAPYFPPLAQQVSRQMPSYKTGYPRDQCPQLSPPFDPSEEYYRLSETRTTPLMYPYPPPGR